MKRVAMGMLLALLSLVSTAATTGSYYGSAASISVGGKKSVTLTASYDPENKEYDTESGVYYLKFTASKGSSYTVYTTGASVSINDMWVEDKSAYVEVSESWSCPYFSVEQDPDYLNYRGILDGDDWTEDDTKSPVYYISIYGDVGATVTVNLSTGIIEPSDPSGSAENPRVIAVGTMETSATASLISGDYYFKANLAAGTRYKFGTTGGTEENTLTLEITAYSEGMEDPDRSELAEWTDDYNEGVVVKALSSGLHLIHVSGASGSHDSFGLRYCMVPARTPAQHKNLDGTALTELKPTKDGQTVDCLPGHRNAPESGYWDDIIDEQLYKATLTAGNYYGFTTDGAATNLLMEVYDASGKVLLTNRGSGKGWNLHATFVPDVTADYWIGICQDLTDDENETPSYQNCTLTAKLLDSDSIGTIAKDARDPMDDIYTGATALDPKPATSGDHPASVGTTDGVHHTLGLTDFRDIFRIDATKGLAYKLQAVQCCSEPSPHAPKCQARIFTESEGIQTDVQTVADATEEFSFTADAETSYYIELSMTDGQGCEFDQYELYSLMYDTQGRELGKLTVEIGGATQAEGAGWTIAGYGTYPGGAFKWLPVGDYTVSFTSAGENWTAPKPVPITLKKGADNPPVSVKYFDVYDDEDDDAKNGDGSRTGAKVATLGESASRSLWSDDLADWHKLPVEAHSLYTLKLAASEKTTNVALRIYRSNGTDVVNEGTVADGRQGLAVTFQARESDTYYVCVSHATTAREDTQYVLEQSVVRVGSIQFSAAQYSVKDTATSVTLTLTRRNGSEGRVRVRYTTQADTALPGTNYVAQTGFFEWADGDATDRTITVTLIPDLVAHWDADRQFTVSFAELEPSVREDNEYVPGLGTPRTATVNILEATKKSVGTVAFAGYGAGVKTEFENVRKPSVTVAGGETVTLWLSRTDGSDDTIAVKVVPVAGTAVADEDFESETQIVTWKHGDAEEKPVTIRTFATEDEYRTARRFAVRLVADRRYASRPRTGTAATVVVRDAQVAASFAEFATACAKSGSGLAVRASDSEAWYFDGAGILRNAALTDGEKSELTVALEGPGKFTCEPQCDGAFSYKIDGVEVADGKSVHYLGTGRHTVRISVAREETAKDSPILTFAAQEDGAPFLFQKLEAATCVSPFQNETILAEDGHVYWSYADADTVGILYVDTYADRANLGMRDAMISTLPFTRNSDECLTCYLRSTEPGNTYVWRVDTAFLDESGNIALVRTNDVWTFKTAVENTVVAGCAGGKDAIGQSIAKTEAGGFCYDATLVQGVSAKIALTSSGAAGKTTWSEVAGAKLPNGLKVVEGVITGVPTKAGEYESILLAKADGKTGTSVSFRFKVLPLALAAGTFNGLLGPVDVDVVAGDSIRQLGSLKATVSQAGKIVVTVKYGTTSQRFVKTGYDGCEEMLESGYPGVTGVLSQVTTVLTNGRRIPCTNTLALVACRGENADALARDVPMSAVLNLHFAGTDGVFTNALFAGEAVRDNAEEDGAAEALSAWSGYYTVALPPKASLASGGDEVKGCGYLLLTITSKGRAKIAGALADGSTFSASGQGMTLTEGEYGDAEFVFPIYSGKAKSVFGGWLRLRFMEDGMAVIRSENTLTWVNADVKSTRDAEEGFGLCVEPTGGWYDTVSNLQAYYLLGGYNVKVSDFWEDFPEELTGGRNVVACPGLYGTDYLDVIGSQYVARTRQLVEDPENPGVIDWESSVNPSNLKLNLSRAKGTYTGSFDVLAENGNSYVTLGTYRPKGVVLFARDTAASELTEADGVIAPGFFTVSVPVEDEETGRTRTWKASYPFSLCVEDNLEVVEEGYPEGGPTE